MWHDALTWEVFIDENMIRGTVGAVREDVILGFRRREWKRVDSRDNRVDQPFRQRCIKESVLGKIRRPSLEASFRELLPSRFWGCLDLARSALVLL